MPEYSHYGVLVGDINEVLGNQVSLLDGTTEHVITTNVTVRAVGEIMSFVEMYYLNPPKNHSITRAFKFNETEYLEKLEKLCDAMMKASKLQQFLSDDSDDMVFFDPPPGSNTDTVAEQLRRQRDDREVMLFAMPALVTFGVDPTASYIDRTLQVNRTTFYQMKMVTTTITSEDPDSNRRDESIIPVFNLSTPVDVSGPSMRVRL
jgi:hypothetical protein